MSSVEFRVCMVLWAASASFAAGTEPAPPPAPAATRPATTRPADTEAHDPYAPAAARFDELFGSDLLRITETPLPDDDVELLGMLVSYGESIKATDRHLAALIADRIESLALRVERRLKKMGETDRLVREVYPARARAAKLLWACDPERQGEAEQRLLAALRDWFRTERGPDRASPGARLVALLSAMADAELEARTYHKPAYDAALPLIEEARNVAGAINSPRFDPLRARVRQLTATRRSVEQIQRLRAILERSPDARIARRTLVRLLVVEMNDPAAAAKHARGLQFNDTERMVQLAAKPIEQLTCDEAQAVAGWYRDHADGAVGPEKTNMLRRVGAFLQRAVAACSETDPLRAKLQHDLEAVKARLERITP